MLIAKVAQPAFNASEFDLPASSSPVIAPIIIPKIIPNGGKKIIPMIIPANDPQTPYFETPNAFEPMEGRM